MSELKNLLTSHSFEFRKQFGQNFISDTNLLNALVADSGVNGESLVLEIGAGAGTLTRAIAEKAGHVIAYEIDSRLVPILEESLSGLNNVRIINRDILSATDSDLLTETEGRSFTVIANLPYYITTPVIMRFLESNLRVNSMTVMVQKEVAERLAAKPDTEEYGAITAAVNIVSDVKYLRSVSRKLFYPSPNVDSAVIRLDVKRDKYAIKDIALLRKVIRAAFAMRRKTLVNNIIQAFAIPREKAAGATAAAGLDERVRGESLTTEQFIKLAEEIGGIIC